MLIIKPADLPKSPHYDRIKELYTQFYHEEVGLHTQLNNGYVPEWNEFDDWVAGMDKYGDTYLVCTEDEGLVTGLVCFSVSDEIGLGMVYTDPAYRQRGLASTLLEYVIQTAHDLGIPRIELTVVSLNAPAIKLYQKYGFLTSLFYMNKKVA